VEIAVDKSQKIEKPVTD